MGMIKCPECKQSVSTIAQNCTHCGVKIENNVMKCVSCGELLIIGHSICPHCHYSLVHTPQTPINPPPSSSYIPPKKKPRTGVYILAIAILTLCGIGYIFYDSIASLLHQNWGVQTEYEQLNNSRDITAYHTFIKNYPDHTLTPDVRTRLATITAEDSLWSTVIHTPQILPLEAFLVQYPTSIYSTYAKHKIDSLSWEYASFTNTHHAIDQYLKEFPLGFYRGEAEIRKGILEADALDQNAKWEIREMIKKHLTALHKQDLETLYAQISPRISNYYGLDNPTHSDIKQHLDELYSDEIAAIRYTPIGEYRITSARTAKGEKRVKVHILVHEQITNESGRFTETNFTLIAVLDGENRICEIEQIF